MFEIIIARIREYKETTVRGVAFRHMGNLLDKKDVTSMAKEFINAAEKLLPSENNKQIKALNLIAENL